MSVADLVLRARQGDTGAFGALVEPYRRELHVHCYRMLGSYSDAEDAFQETLVSAWQGLARFEGRSSVRTWLYRVATSRCLNAMRAANRRPAGVSPPTNGVAPPDPTRFGDVPWLEPYPQVLLDELVDPSPGPEARVESRAAISLAFVTALQVLPARQRAVLVLRDVLAFSTAEVAEMLGGSQAAVTSALARARASIAQRREGDSRTVAAPAPRSASEDHVVELLTRAIESGDVPAIVALLTEDVWLTMPPMPLEYQGRELAHRFLAAVAFPAGRCYRVVASRANGQPALGIYILDPATGWAHANGVWVLSLTGERVHTLTRFDSGILPHLGLPRHLH